MVGFASGRIAGLPMNHILLRNRTVVGVEWATWITTNTQHLARTLEVVLNGLARGVLHPPKPHLVSLRELPQDLAGEPPSSGLVRTVMVPSLPQFSRHWYEPLADSRSSAGIVGRGTMVPPHPSSGITSEPVMRREEIRSQ